jgi:Tripartite tricarboxylate transporter family receptor
LASAFVNQGPGAAAVLADMGHEQSPAPFCEHRKSDNVYQGISSPKFGRRIMKLPHRRQFLHLAAGAAAIPVFSRTACAQAYPSRPVRVIVGFGAGTAADIVARLIGAWLSERLGQPVIIENRPGAGSNMGAQAVVRAPADGHTLLLVTTTNAINATLYNNLDFNLSPDIAPVAGLIHVPNVLVVNPSVPAKTVPEFIAYAEANPGKLNMASVGNGTMPHVSGELFNMMAGVRMVNVQYRGAPPALTDLLGGQVQVYFASTTVSIEHIRVPGVSVGPFKKFTLLTKVHVDSAAGVASAPAREPDVALRVRQRTRVAIQDGWLRPDDRARGSRRRAGAQGAPAHSAPRLRVRPCQQGSRHSGDPGMARTPVDHQHGGVRRAGAEPV